MPQQKKNGKKMAMAMPMPDAYKRKTSELGRMRIRPVRPKTAMK